MPTITWLAGDKFTFKADSDGLNTTGYGIILGDNKSVTIEGEGSIGYLIKKSQIPENARTYPENIPFEIYMALLGALVASGIKESVLTKEENIL